MPRFLWPAGGGPSGLCPPDWINVTCAPYNAKGDGTTDDTAAIVKAAAAALANPTGPVPLYFPAGTYVYNGGVAGVTLQLAAIFGDGAQLSILKEMTPLGGATPSFALGSDGGMAWDMGFALGTNAPCLLLQLAGYQSALVNCSVIDSISTANTTTMVAVTNGGCNVTDCAITGNGQLLVTSGSCGQAGVIVKGNTFTCSATTDAAVTLGMPNNIIDDCWWPGGSAPLGLSLSGAGYAASGCLLGTAAIDIAASGTVSDCQCGNLEIAASNVQVSNCQVGGTLTVTIGTDLSFTGCAIAGDVALSLGASAGGTCSFVNCQFQATGATAVVTVSLADGVGVPLRLAACDLLGAGAGGAIDLTQAIPLLLLDSCQLGFATATNAELVSGTAPTNSIVSASAFVNCLAPHALSFTPGAAAANLGTL